MTDAERAAAFLAETYRRRVERVEMHPWGELVVTPSLPQVWDANFALVTSWTRSAEELIREMERVQESAGFAHRKTVILDEGLAGRVWPGIRSGGFEFASRYVLMAKRRPPDREPDPDVRILEVGKAEWADGRRAMIELEGHGSVTEQLIELDDRLAAVIEVRHLAALVDGEVASYAGLYLDGAIAQIEDVATLPGYRGRGLARAIVLCAAAEARLSGAELVFLVADEDDWPKKLYARLGFDPIGLEHVFGRSPGQHVE